jgi:hypothetical protein
VARWLVAGYGSSTIARQLGLEPHTIARWKRDLRVVEIIQQLRARADAAVVAMTARRALVAADGSPRSDIPTSRAQPSRRASDAAQDAIAERIIARALDHRGKC